MYMLTNYVCYKSMTNNNKKPKKVSEKTNSSKSKQKVHTRLCKKNNTKVLKTKNKTVLTKQYKSKQKIHKTLHKKTIQKS